MLCVGETIPSDEGGGGLGCSGSTGGGLSPELPFAQGMHAQGEVLSGGVYDLGFGGNETRSEQVLLRRSNASHVFI